jgi:ubiquinone biosynthesis protein
MTVAIDQSDSVGVGPSFIALTNRPAASFRRPDQHPRGPSLGDRISFLFMAVARSARLTVLTLVAAPALLFRRLLGPSGGPRVLRWYFEHCGGAYVKVGQLLATRYDLLRPGYTEELGKLLDSLPVVPTEKILERIEQSLGRPAHELFPVFDPEPIATASLAQVHGAVLAGGDAVVVKVLKPGIAQQFRVDLWFLGFTARLLDVLPVLRGLDVGGPIDELCRTVIDELDLSREAMYTAFIHEQMAADTVAHYTPRVYRHLSNGDVLTLERINGVTVREMLTAVSRGDEIALAAWAARGITPQRTAVILFRSVLEQTMRYRTFNADPHPSNLIVSDGGTLNWVDFGAVGWMDERDWDLQLRLREAIAHERIHGAYLALLESMEPLPYRNFGRFEAEFKRLLSDFLLASRDPDAPLSQKSTGSFLFRALAILRRNRLPVATTSVQLYRTILVADIVMLGLYPTIDWRGHLRRFLQDLAGDLLQETVKDPLSSPYTAYRLAQLPMAAVDTIDWVTRRLPEIGRQTMRSLSAAERLLPYSLRLLRRAAVIGILAVIGIAVIKPDRDPSSGIGQVVQGIVENPWPALGAGVLTVLVLSSFIRRANPT